MECLQNRDTVVMPHRPDANSKATTATLRLVRAFEFNSQILKSGMLVTSDVIPAGTGLLFVKGAHTAIKRLISAAALPADYDKASMLDDHAL